MEAEEIDRAALERWKMQFCDYCNELFCKDYDYYIFMTRKCYFYMLVLEETGDIKIPEGTNILRDRDIIKVSDLGKLEGKKVLLIDDTAISGETLLNMANRIKDKVKNIGELSISVFAITPEFIETYLKKEDFQELNPTFSRILSEGERTDFITGEMTKIHEEMKSYVVDLPVLEPFTVSNEEFDQLVNGENTRWKFYNNDFDILGHHYRNGVFFYHNEYLEGKFRKILLKFTVKCRYEEIDEGVRLQLTPFAMFKSANYDDMETAFYYFFENTPYADKMKRLEVEGRNEEKAITYYRAIVYLISYYLGLLFLEYLKAYINIDFNQKFQKGECYKAVPQITFLNTEFRESIDCIFNDFTVDKFLKKLENFYCFESGDGEEEYGIYLDGSSELKCAEAVAYVAGQIALQSREITDGRKEKEAVKIEKIMDMLKSNFAFINYSQFYTCLCSIILRLLDKSVLSNQLSVSEDKEIIERSFEFGETSDIYFEYDATLFYTAIYAYYNVMKNRGEDYRENYEEFILALKDFFRKNSYFEYGYISMEAFNFFAEFYRIEYKNKRILLKELSNKKCFLDNVKLYGTGIVPRVMKFVAGFHENKQ